MLCKQTKQNSNKGILFSGRRQRTAFLLICSLILSSIVCGTPVLAEGGLSSYISENIQSDGEEETEGTGGGLSSYITGNISGNDSSTVIEIIETETSDDSSPDVSSANSASGYPLYDEVIGQYIVAVRSGWGMEDYLENSMTPMAGYCTTVSDMGYFLEDLNGDGMEELFIGLTSDTSIFYDMYTIKNGELLQLAVGTERSWYGISLGGMVFNGASDSAFGGFTAYYAFEGESLVLSDALIYNSEETGGPYFYSTSGTDDYSNPISEDEYENLDEVHRTAELTFSSMTDIEEELSLEEEYSDQQNEIVEAVKNYDLAEVYVGRFSESFPLDTYFPETYPDGPVEWSYCDMESWVYHYVSVSFTNEKGQNTAVIFEVSGKSIIPGALSVYEATVDGEYSEMYTTIFEWLVTGVYFDRLAYYMDDFYTNGASSEFFWMAMDWGDVF